MAIDIMTEEFKYKYLMEIDSPYDLRQLPESALEQVANEVREYMIDTITKVGGHFGAGLGVVELTVALHYIFNTPDDKIVFDVGHQGYPHKILTGRRDLLHTIRQLGGLSGFLKRTESEYDAFGAGHASTSISAALGLATSRDLQGKNNKVIAVIGDGAMTGGLAYEAMNNCGVQKRDIIVILNDNNISIEPNVSAFSNYFSEFYASNAINMFRERLWNISGKMDQFGDRLRKVAARLEDGVKAIITPGVLFETLGFNYFGPINGHNVKKLVRLLRQIKDLHGPIFLHIITNKGKGFAPAEKDIYNLHAIGKIDKVTGESLSKKLPDVTVQNYSTVFGNAMYEICKMNQNVVGITAAMGDGTGLIRIEKDFPDRFFDVGIAEGHAVTFAAGLACAGTIPVVAIYSSFLQRAFDHLVHDVAIQGLHVVFAIDRAGLVGADGATHHGVLDICYLRSVQGLVLMAPRNENELRNMLYTAVFSITKGPVAIRFPRGNGEGIPLEALTSIPLGKSELLKAGNDIAILSLGTMCKFALKAAEALEAENISVEVIDPRFVKPLDTNMIDELCKRFDTIVTVEDGQQMGGFGSAVAEYLMESGNNNTRVKILGIPDKFINHGTQEELHQQLEIDDIGLIKHIKRLLNK